MGKLAVNQVVTSDGWEEEDAGKTWLHLTYSVRGAGWYPILYLESIDQEPPPEPPPPTGNVPPDRITLTWGETEKVYVPES